MLKEIHNEYVQLPSEGMNEGEEIWFEVTD